MKRARPIIKSWNRHFIILLLALTLFSTTIWGAAPIVLNDQSESVALDSSLEYLEDADRSYTIEQVISPEFLFRFNRNRQGVLNIGFTDSVYWLRFSIRNRSKHVKTWLLEIAYPHLDRITLFSPSKSGQLWERTTGDLFPFSEREFPHSNFLFELPLEKEITTFYLRVETESSMQLPISIHSASGFSKADRKYQYGFGIFCGIMLAIILYNLFLLGALKDVNYLFYILYLSGHTFLQLNMNGIGFELLWPDSPAWCSRAMLMSAAFTLFWATVFAKYFLAIPKNLPRVSWLYNLLLLYALFLFVAPFFFSYSVIVRLFGILTVSVIFTIIITAISCYLKGYSPARYFLIAWFVFLTSILVYVLWLFGILPTHLLTRYGLQFGSALEAILLSLALADRLLVVRKEYENALRVVVADRTEQLRGKDEKLIREISAHRRTAQSFQESEEKYRVLVENSSLCIGISKGEQIVFGNPAMLDLLGYEDEGELKRDSLIRLVVPENRENVRNRIRKRSAGDQVPTEFENKLLRKDGSVIIVEQNSSEIQIENETYLLSTFKDISDRKKSEKAMAAAREKAEEASRLKSEFLANISHEIRTPMQAIIGYTNLAIGRFKQTKKAKLLDYFEEISQSGKRLLSLLNDLLDLSKLESGKMEYVYEKESISFLIEFAIRELQALLEEKQLTVHFDKPGFDDFVTMDREKIMQVIHNLLSNAVKFSPENGKLHLDLVRKKGDLVFSVSDEGIGIPTAELVSIFDKFTQSTKTKTGAGGTGLGLAICYEIIKAHQGQIWADNNLEGGAVFSFSLPENFSHE